VLNRFRSLSQVQQIVVVSALIGLCCATMITVWFFFVRTPYQPLFSDLRPADAATIVAELDRKKIPYRLSSGGTSIAVPVDRVDATRLNIMTEDLPLKGTVGFELFNKADMGLTDFAQRINYIRAIQGELERTIMTLDGVAAARVHVSLGEDRIFRDEQVPPKASVTVRMVKGAALDQAAVQGIQRLIAGAIPKLDANNVAILDESGRIVSAVPQEKPAAAPLSPIAQERQAIEQFYVSRIRLALEQSYSQEKFDVQVSALLPVQAGGSAGEFYRWSPTYRDFPLQVTVLTATELDDAQPALRAIVTAAIGIVPGRNDVVSFGPLKEFKELKPPAVEDAAPVAATGVRQWSAPTAIKPPEQRSVYWDTPYVLFPLLVLLAIWLLVRQARAPRQLSEQERAQFASRLHRAVERRVSRAAS
jgi:flagellar M-ring protein FliF